MAFTQADFILQACERSIEPTEEMYFDSVYTPQPNFHLDVLDDCVIALRNPAFSAVKEAIADIENQSKDGTPVDAGFGADFNDAGGPVASWVWFSRPVNGPVRAKFEERFNGTFDEEGLRMDIPTDDFLAFADSGAWNAFAVEDDEDDQVLFE